MYIYHASVELNITFLEPKIGPVGPNPIDGERLLFWFTSESVENFYPARKSCWLGHLFFLEVHDLDATEKNKTFGK